MYVDLPCMVRIKIRIKTRRGEMEMYFYKALHYSGIIFFKLDTHKLKICNINPKTITKVAQQRVITNKTIKEIK